MHDIWMMIHRWTSTFCPSASLAKICASVLCSAGLIVLAFLICRIAAWVSGRFLSRHTDSAQHQEKSLAFRHAAIHLLFVCILCAGLPDLFPYLPAVSHPLARLLNATAVLLCARALTKGVTWGRSILHGRTKKHAMPTKTLAQVTNILIWFTAGIILVSTLMGKSPTFVLSGLGALTAVLMLIFRDSLLGLVAGVQVTQNDMVRLGDWITMPKYNADGNVIDIALTTVKVQNFDNTVTMIPSSALISDSFVNWRYMSVSKGRRIKRPVWINASTIRDLSPEQRQTLVEQKLLEEQDHPVSNLAAFEIWLRRMLKSHPDITQELTCMVRQTEAGDTGIPVEIYAFTKTRDWVKYEEIQTDLFDRIFVTIPKFGLHVYQRTGDRPLTP